MVKKIAILGALLFSLSVLPAACDNLILAPSGSNLHTGQVRAEGAIGMKDSDNRYYWLGFGANQFEVSLLSRDRVNGPDTDVVSVQYQFLPQTLITPALSIGIRDVFDDEDEGFSPYIALTKTVLRDISFIESLELTAGTGANSVDGVFGGATLKLPYNLRLQGEYFNDHFNGSLGFTLGNTLSAKVYRVESTYLYGLQFSPFRF